MTNPNESEPQPEIGRVLRASTTGFAIGCRVAQLSDPAFGSLVKAVPIGSGEAVYGLIYNMNVDDDPLVRRLVLAESPRRAVIEDQRQNRLLPIEMNVLTVGYEVAGTVHYGLPPRPPLNLDPVYLYTDRQAVVSFTDNPGYLRLILRATGGVVPVDQLLVAHIRQTFSLRGEDSAWALTVIRELIELLRADYELLIPTLEALNDALPTLQPASTVPDSGAPELPF